jgi:hypothetical protein
MPPSSYDTQAPVVVAMLQAVEALQDVSTALQESMGAQRLPGSGTFAFRRITDPLQVPVAATATKFDVPDGFFAEGGPGYQTTTFLVVNPNACYVRLRGTTSGPHRPVSPRMGWLFPPGFVGAFSTQYPVTMSALAVPMPGAPLPTEFAPLDLIYGGGT